MSIDTLVTRSDFAGAFKAVKPHVIGKADDTIFSALRNVEIRFFEDHLTMTATNRYTLAEARVNYMGDNRLPGETGTTAVLVNVDDLAYALKRADSRLSHLSVQLKDNALVLDYTTEAPLDQDSAFPKLAHLWPTDGAEPVEQSSVMLNPAYLAMFDSRNLARDKYEKNVGLRLSFRGKGKPMDVTFGDHFRGLIMPIREAT